MRDRTSNRLTSDYGFVPPRTVPLTFGDNIPYLGYLRRILLRTSLLRLVIVKRFNIEK